MYKKILILSIVMLILDYIWLNYYMKHKYKIILNDILKIESSINYFSAIIAYIIMTFSIYYFVLKNKKSIKGTVIDAAILGFVMFGIYDATLYAVFPITDYKTAFIDVLWGTFLYGISTYTACKLT